MRGACSWRNRCGEELIRWKDFRRDNMKTNVKVKWQSTAEAYGTERELIELAARNSH